MPSIDSLTADELKKHWLEARRLSAEANQVVSDIYRKATEANERAEALQSKVVELRTAFLEAVMREATN